VLEVFLGVMTYIIGAFLALGVFIFMLTFAAFYYSAALIAYIVEAVKRIARQ
jgi:hypothetical protein